MNIFKLIGFLFAASLVLISCKTIDIHEGRIPDEYLYQAKKIEGVYRGQFNGVPGDLIISLEGNKPMVSFRNEAGDDMLNNVLKNKCHSSFGNLRQIFVKKKNDSYQVENALYDFDPSEKCKVFVDGRIVEIEFVDTKQGLSLNLKLVQNIEAKEVCFFTSKKGKSKEAALSCETQRIPHYLKGSFLR